MATAKYKRGKDGYFQAKVWDGTYVGNKKHYVPVRTKKSSKDLENKVAEFKAQVEARKVIRKTDVTFLEYAREWKKVYKDQKEDNTKAMYDRIIEKHFNALDPVYLRDIDRIHLQVLLNNASGKNRTQQQIYMIFKQVLVSAVADHLFPANIKDDIFNSIDRPNYSSGEKRPLTESERTAVFKADFNEQDKIFVYLLYGCGIRRGECLALTIFDVNIRARELNINKSHSLVNDKPKQKGPKSANGNRTIPIPDKVFPAIKSWVEHCKATNRSYLFTMRSGQPLTKSSYNKMWKRIIAEMQAVSDEQIAGLTAHVFRHNYCTNLCYQIPTVSIKRIAQLLGDTEKMVLDVYNHVILEKEDAAGAINSAMNF